MLFPWWWFSMMAGAKAAFDGDPPEVPEGAGEPIGLLLVLTKAE
jgi:hypothetical protein